MRDCIPFSPLPFSISKVRNFGLNASSSGRASPLFPPSNAQFNSILTRARTRRRVWDSQDGDFYDELGFKQKGKQGLEFQSIRDQYSTRQGYEANLELVELKGEGGRSQQNWEEGEEIIGAGDDGIGSETERRMIGGRVKLGRRWQVLKRSSVLAKQVISITTALSLGFISQLWVDTTNWVVVVVEVRPNLLSGESEMFLLQDICQVGDVVLVEDGNILENEFSILGLETLVGYQVVTPSQRNIGKVRGFSFNINSGTVESLELDSFGISIIPSSLVSTYTLLAEDVVEVFPDTIIVDEAAASRIQRLTKGLWDARPVDDYAEEVGEFPDDENGLKIPAGSGRRARSRRRSKSKRFQQEMREDDWELPMDYL
ncbi:unnamed protein product [Linum trigynum]|uniref:PRC-barrel domain-containing protein n=1 Tax=Linum trigynum TaxID=586398 RepID=A0AAV2FQV3_9ROSI